jgi:hypothetical protein
VLVKAYPASFQSEYGSKMAEVFRDLASDALRERDADGLMMVWYRVLRDLPWTIPREHSLESQRSFQPELFT